MHGATVRFICKSIVFLGAEAAMLATNFHWVPRLGRSGVILLLPPLPPHSPSWYERYSFTLLMLFFRLLQHRYTKHGDKKKHLARSNKGLACAYHTLTWVGWAACWWPPTHRGSSTFIVCYQSQSQVLCSWPLFLLFRCTKSHYFTLLYTKN